MAILKIMIFGISTIGTWECLRMISKDRINIYFFPSLTIAIQTLILFFAGLLNILSEVVYLLLAIGLAGSIYSIYRNGGVLFLKNYINAGFLWLILVMVIMLFFVRGKIFTHYDNFSHWALVVKRMLQVNRYPNFEDTLITFQEYPLGSATYIYYFSKLISTSESIQMLAHIYMIAAAALPLFVFVKKNSVLSALVMISFVNFVFVYNITITNLLVDTVLPIIAMCSLIFTYLHCRKGCGRLELICASAYMVQLVQIKNSGIFFVALIDIVILICGWKNKNYAFSALSALVPFGSLILWQKHCKYVFSSAATSKHAMTVENYSNVFGDKTSEDIRTISISLFKFVTTWKDVWVMIAIILFVGIGIWLTKAKIWKIYMKTCIFSVVMYVAYQLGMLAMYLFSMPIDEAIVLASVTRYTKTILLAILYLMMIPMLKVISEVTIEKIIGVIVILGFCMSFFVYLYISFGKVKLAIQYTDNPEERNWIEGMKNAYGVPNESSYCVLIPKSDSGYVYFLEKYIFQSNSVGSAVISTQEDMDNITAKYVFLYDQNNEIVNAWVKNHYPDQYGNDVIIQGEK